MRELRFSPKFYFVIPLLVWFLLTISPLISFPSNMPPTAHIPFLLHILIANTLLLIIFYLHTYLLYPLLKNRRFLAYSAGVATLVILYCIYFRFFNFGAFNGPQRGFEHGHGPGPMDGGHPMNGPGNFIPVVSLMISLLCSFCYRVIIDNAARESLLKEKETTHLRTELNFLRSQINPHFLFNILNNMTSLARKKSELLEPAIVNLAQLMRYMLYESADNKVFLSKEVAYLKNYINLQMLRFNGEVTVDTSFTGDYEVCQVDPMLLIPIVENAFKYGTEKDDNNLIIIDLDVTADCNKMYFKVVNFFDTDRIVENTDSGIGLANIQRRLDIVYPGKHEFNTSVVADVFTAELYIELA